MRYFLLLALAACRGSTDAPPAPPPSPPPELVATTADARRLPVRADAAHEGGPGAVDARHAVDAGAPVTELVGTPMVGPAPTLAAACASLAPCGFTALDQRDRPTRPPRKPDCGLITGDDDPYGNHGGRHIEGDLELRVAPLRCAVPDEIRAVDQRYLVLVRRPDGWWRSAPLIDASVNDKYCMVTFTTRWERHDALVFARLHSTHGCVACNKQGSEEHVLELVIGIDAQAPIPRVFAPLVTGQRYEARPDVDAELDPAEPCPVRTSRTVHAETWSAPDTLTLSGRPSWHPLVWTDGLLQLAFRDQQQAPSTIGTYRFRR